MQKVLDREEILLEPLLSHFDRIQLPDETVNEILGHLRKALSMSRNFQPIPSKSPQGIRSNPKAIVSFDG